MPTAQSAQHLLRNLDSNWGSFFKSIKDWGKHKDKYNGRPKLPKYKEKNGRYILTGSKSVPAFKVGNVGEENKWVTFYAYMAQEQEA